MSYAELLKEWRAGVLPVRDFSGRKREALKAPNGGNVPALPVLPGAEHEGEQEPEPATNQVAAGDLKPTPRDNPLSAPVLVLVRCGQCQHFERDTINPAEGIGRCGAAVESERPHYPNAPRHCATWNPTPAALLDICGAACDGLAVKPEELAHWLLAQDDAQWMTPPAAHRWAELIQKNGWPE